MPCWCPRRTRTSMRACRLILLRPCLHAPARTRMDESTVRAIFRGCTCLHEHEWMRALCGQSFAVCESERGGGA
eukprot:9643221-Alexandrium_andersonii.AAC.1